VFDKWTLLFIMLLFLAEFLRNIFLMDSCNPGIDAL
jgi:hypothetical protein